MVASLVPFLLAALAVEGDARCPSKEQLRAALAKHGALAPRDRHTVSVREGRSDVVLTLTDEAGQRLGTRALPAGSSCEALAEAAAVVVSAWEAELDAKPSTLELAPPPPAPVREPLRVEVDLGAGVSAARVAAPGFSLGVRVSRGERGLLLGATVLVPFPRSEPLGAGTIDWMRPVGALGAGYRWRLGPVGLDGQLGVGLVLIIASGHGFTSDQQRLGVQPATVAVVRARWAEGGLRPFVGLATAFFLLPQVLEITGVSQARGLTRAELSAVLGISWGG
ncbi:MAG: hypothetical protein K1X89_21065 [Myxococcaceae bacterium]|nr:hypothetical protein [Myxococcaceae bacterium]